MDDKTKVHEAFDRWFYASKYAQLVTPNSGDVQRAWDAWQAAIAWKGTAEECSVVAEDAFVLMRFIFRHFGDVSMSHHLTDEVVQATRRIEAIADKREAPFA